MTTGLKSREHATTLDVEAVRRDFPILTQRAHGQSIIYFDNAATAQKPQAVIDAERAYYQTSNANVHRAVHELSQRATRAYEEARETIRGFVNAAHSAEIIFTRGTTESINLVASSLSQIQLSSGDEIVLTEMEHHSNIVPWQLAAQRHGAKIVVVPVNDAGELILEKYEALLSTRTKIIAFSHISNALGTINPAEEMIRLARAKAPNAAIVIDGAQWVSHHKTDVRALDCDFYCFSGHKLYGPTGIGILYGKRRWLDAMPPYQGGGDMIETVSFEMTTYAQLPNKFEAGTPNIAGVVGLEAAIRYVQKIGLEKIAAHEQELLDYATRRMSELPHVRIVGTAAEKAAVISFVVGGTSALDIGLKLDSAGVAVRTGHHCCMPLMNRFGLMESGGTVRASFAMFNTTAEIDVMIDALKAISPIVRRAPKDLEFAAAFAESPTSAADTLADDFEMLGDPQNRNQYVLDLGEKLPNTFDQLKKLTTRVQGCMSEVYLVGRKKPGSDDRFEFVADANADIVRGLIVLLERLYSGQRIVDIKSFDIEGFFKRIGLDQFITQQRRNGLSGMIEKIRTQAGGAV